MKPKMILKIVIDVFMSLALLVLMGYQFWGDAAHEWVGVCMLVLFIAHHVLNFGWYRSLFKGRYTPYRIIQLVINFLILIFMLIQMYSGIVMSREVFAFLPINGGLSLARKLHIIGSYWGFVLMSFHLGLHWNMFIGMAGKTIKNKKPSRARSAVLIVFGALVAAYGLYAFIKRGLIDNMLLKSEFVFLDFSESKILFYLDYIAIMGLFIFIAHYVSKIIRKITSNNKINKSIK